MKLTQYTCGGGSVGCLYDCGPDTAATLDDAIESLATVYDLSTEEKNQLRWHGHLSFDTTPGSALDTSDDAELSRRAEAGADYCEVTSEEVDVDDTVIALAAHLGCNHWDIEAGRDVLEAEGGEYRVLTDSEADTAADEALESYIDDCILSGQDGVLAQYFDRDSWKRDALLSDGRGHTLSSYDGAEEEETVDGVTYYIYRVN